jgi:hypothetical protein
MLSLVRRPAVESLGGRAIEDVDSRHHHLSLKDSRHSPLLEEGLSHPHNRLVASLDDVVLLWAVPRGVVALNTLIRAVQREFSRREFFVVNSPPLLVRNTRNLRLHSAFAAACARLMAFVASPLLPRTTTHM